MSQYNSELQLWYDKQEERKHLFVIRDVPDIKNGKIPRTPSGKLKSLSTGVPPSDVDLRKYDALPPIKSGEGRPKRRVVEEEVECDVIKPVPPESQVVHLNVSVTYHMVEGFRTSQQHDINTHFVQRYPLMEKSTEHTPASKEEFSTIEAVLSMLIKDVIDDQDFMRDFNRLKEEPIPYFNMIPKQEEECVEQEEQGEEGGGGGGEENGKIFGPVKISVLAASPSDTTVDSELVDIIQTGDVIMTSQEDEGRTKTMTEADVEYAKQMMQRQDLKRDDEFRNILNEVLENTLYNILCEADHGEISLTNRPRIIVLPPSDVATKASVSA